MNLRKQLDIAFSKKPEVNGSIQGERNLKKPAPYMSVFKFPSRKAEATLFVEGNLEHAAVILFELSPLVRNIRSQAIEIRLSTSQYSIPDFGLEMVDGTRKIVEIKPSKTALTLEQQDRFFAAEQLLAREGIGFQLLDQNDLPNYATTQKLLHLYCRGHRIRWNPHTLEQALEVLKQDCHPTVAAMHDILRKENLPIYLAEYFVFHQKKKTLDTDILFKNFSVIDNKFLELEE